MFILAAQMEIPQTWLSEHLGFNGVNEIYFRLDRNGLKLDILS